MYWGVSRASAPLKRNLPPSLKGGKGIKGIVVLNKISHQSLAREARAYLADLFFHLILNILVTNITDYFHN